MCTVRWVVDEEGYSASKQVYCCPCVLVLHLFRLSHKCIKEIWLCDVVILIVWTNQTLHIHTSQTWFHLLFLTCLFVYLLLFYILPTSKVTSGQVPTCDSAHSSQLYNAAPLGNLAISIMIWYPTKAHYPDTEPTSPIPILIMLSSWLGSDKYKCYKS